MWYFFCRRRVAKRVDLIHYPYKKNGRYLFKDSAHFENQIHIQKSRGKY